MYSRRPVVRRSAVRRGPVLAPGGPLKTLAETFPAYAPVVLWAVTGAVVTLLALRFGMRLVGVRGDVPLPGAIYALTSPLVEPFYRAFPASDRFDYPTMEVASLVAAGVVIGAAVVIYAVGLLVSVFLGRGREEDGFVD
jgi:uncharacterized protein YggT (Ycf19 family)